MPLETATYIDGLISSNPAATDGIAQADDHMRLIKSTLLATFPSITGAVTLTHTQINALETRVGSLETGYLAADGSVAATSDIPFGTNKATGLGDPTAAQDAATKAYVDAQITAEVTARNSAIQAMYPVGSIFIAAVATNPGTLLGFGTWTAYAEGRVLVGVGSGTDANTTVKAFTLGETNGEYTHAITESELPAHSHASAIRVRSAHLGNTWENVDGSTSTSTGFAAGETNSSQSDIVRPNTAETGGGSFMSLEQPYIGVHIWQRTA